MFSRIIDSILPCFMFRRANFTALCPWCYTQAHARVHTHMHWQPIDNSNNICLTFECPQGLTQHLGVTDTILLNQRKSFQDFSIHLTWSTSNFWKFLEFSGALSPQHMTHTIWEPLSAWLVVSGAFPQLFVFIWYLLDAVKWHFRAWKVSLCQFGWVSGLHVNSSHSDANKLGLYSH